MKNSRMPGWLLFGCAIASCALCIWAWLFAIYYFFWGLAALPAFFLQALIRRGGNEWKWLLSVHAMILLGTAGIGGLMILITENMAQIYGLLLTFVGGSALAGCLFELVLYLVFGRKDEMDET